MTYERFVNIIHRRYPYLCEGSGVNEIVSDVGDMVLRDDRLMHSLHALGLQRETESYIRMKLIEYIREHEEEFIFRTV